MDKVSQALKAHIGKNLLERYALYMLRVQMYELGLKNDLAEQFGVENTERMNFSSIFRYYVKHDIRAHPILYLNIQEVAQERNKLAHESLAVWSSLSAIPDDGKLMECAMKLFSGQLDKFVENLELAYQNYLMLKKLNTLYEDYGISPSFNNEKT